MAAGAIVQLVEVVAHCKTLQPRPNQLVRVVVQRAVPATVFNGDFVDGIPLASS